MRTTGHGPSRLGVKVLERTAPFLPGRKGRRYLRLLIPTACAAFMELARGQSASQSYDTLPVPRLRSAAALSKIAKRPVQPIPKAGARLEMPGLRMAHQLSLKSAPTASNSDKAAAPVQAMPVAAGIEQPEQPVSFDRVRPESVTEGIEQPEPPVPFETVRQGTSVAISGASEPSPDNLPDLTTVDWVIPPIQWGGNTSSSYGWNGSQDGGMNFNQSQNVNLRASSYIYRPWYAQVSGNIGLSSGTSGQSGGDSSANGGTRSTAVSYGGDLSLFPVSRFPFQAYINSSNSRASADAQGQAYTSLRMGARQSYRPEDGPETYSASADRSIVTSSNIHSVVDSLQGAYSTVIASHNITAGSHFAQNTGDVGGQSSRLFRMNGTHSWRIEDGPSVASSANYSNDQISFLNGSGLSLNKSQVLQFGSSLSWQPNEDWLPEAWLPEQGLPLTLVGGGNFLNINTVTESGQQAVRNINGYLNASYRFSNNLSATAGLTATQTQNNESSFFTFGQNISVSYFGNPLIIGDYSYNWGTGGGISNQFISGGENNSNLFGQVQHSLARSFALGPTSAVALNATQTLSLSNNSTTGQSGTLTHAGGASWNRRLGERTAGALSATVSDTISFGSYASHFRSLSAQGNADTQFSRRSGLQGSLNMTATQQLTTPKAPGSSNESSDLATASDDKIKLNGSAQLSYTHRSPFDIANLFYSATAQANASQTNLRLISGDPNALAWQTGYVLSQTLDYRLGRLTFRANASVATLNGKENASLYFTISRELGNF